MFYSQEQRVQGVVRAVKLCPSPGLVPRVHEVLDVVVGGDGQLGQVLHVGPHQRVLADPQVALVLGVQQVTHALAVDLHVAHLNAERGGQHRESAPRADVVAAGSVSVMLRAGQPIRGAHLHRVSHVVVDVGVVELGEQVLTELGTEPQFRQY